MIKILTVGIVLFFASLGQAQETIWTPDSSVKFALADLQTIHPAQQPYIRYLSLYNIPKERRAAVGQTVSFVVNSLSTRHQMYIPVFVGGSDNTVIRLNIKDYNWKNEDFEGLIIKGSGPRPYHEPYFNVLVEKAVKKIVKKPVSKEVLVTKKVFSGHYDQYRQPIYETKKVKEVVEIEVEVDVEGEKASKVESAPWLEPRAIATLIQVTQTAHPIARADWFTVNATLPPAYYNFLHLGTDFKDFENLVFADDKLAEKARSQYKGAVIQSSVARNNRTLTRSPTFTDGYLWRSKDTLRSTSDRKYVSNLLNEKFDATEDIGTLPNGLQAYFLTDGTGKRLDSALIDIAVDNTAVDRVIRTGRSCIICHAEGIKPIDDEIRKLNQQLQNIENIKLLITDESDAYRVLDLFGGDLDKKIIRDQQIYYDAVAVATGLSAELNAKQYGQIYNNYAEYLLSKEIVAREVGVSLPELDKYIRLSNDPVLLGLIKTPIRAVRRDQFEESFQQFMLTILAARNVPGIQQLPVPPIYRQ